LYKNDAAFFLNLRASVTQRYSDTIDYSQYEGQIQKLIDKHIQTDEVKTITPLINIFDKEKFQQELDKTKGKAARADIIASRTAKHITEKMDEDPAFYKKFSQMLKETIQAFIEKRISETEFLTKVTNIMDTVVSHKDTEIPSALENHEVARAFYGLIMEDLDSKFSDEATKKAISVQMAMDVDNIIRKFVLDNGVPIVDWHDKRPDLKGKILIEVGDLFIDEVRDKYDIELSFDEIDAIADRCIDVSKRRYKS
jgi:type I restriction enzyme R subunit